MKITSRKYALPALLCLFVIIGILYYYFFSALSASEKTEYLYIDDDDNIDSVFAKVKPIACEHGITGFQTLARHSSLTENIRSGRYAVKPSDGAFTLFRKLRDGMQEPLDLTIPSVRTIDRLAGYVGHKMMMDSLDIYQALTDEATCEKYGYDTLTIACMFIPNTYDIYWNISVEGFLDRMKKESDRFWNSERRSQLESLGISLTECCVLASIIDEETNADDEKPMVAGMYYNRLKANMPLQADPTIKFALKDFSIRRIYHKMLDVDSPYNTYRHTGLPPGPIRIPSVAGIDAVLNMVHHDYLYMCAKEDFSGKHNFAKTYEEHLRNAAKYSEALNKRGIQ